MYFIKKIIVNDNEYETSHIIEHTNKTISVALLLLETTARQYVINELGRESGENSNIIDIYNISQINEPLIDSILLYRLETNPHQIHVYRKKTNIIKTQNWTWGISENLVSTFKKVCIFELDEYNKLNIDEEITSIELVSIGNHGIKIPKQMTISPMTDVINELKNCDKFKSRSL